MEIWLKNGKGLTGGGTRGEVAPRDAQIESIRARFPLALLKSF